MRPDMKEITRAAAVHFNVSLESLMGQSRKKVSAFPRQIAMYLGKHLAGRTTTAIGQHFSGRDHTTAVHACQTIGKQAAEDDEVLRDIMTVAAIASGYSMDRQALDRDWSQTLRPKKRVVIKPYVFGPPDRVRWLTTPPRPAPCAPRRPILLPSEFAPPSKARLMGARA